MTTRDAMRDQLRVHPADVKVVSDFLADPGNRLVEGLLDLIDKYGGVDQINRTAAEAGHLETRLELLREERSPYLADLDWLTTQRDEGAFVTLPEYRRSVLGDAAETMVFDEAHAVTLEISALQYFPWLISEARQAIEWRELMPGRFIRVRNMAEQSRPGGDIIAVAAAMQIVGASHVETLDTRGIDGTNVMLGGPDTITGYFGGIGQPNSYALNWADECLHYLTEYGIRQVLNVNSGTILLSFLMHKLGIENEFKVSVFVGVDNPFAVMWLLMGARLFGDANGSTGLAGLNLSNSVDTETLRDSSYVRAALGLAGSVRLEHHVTEAYKSIVRQPYERRDDVVEAAAAVPNISAKHEGGDPSDEVERDHPSDIFDYFLTQADVQRRGLMPVLESNYLDKHAAVNRTAAALTRKGIGVCCASALHAVEVREPIAPAIGMRDENARVTTS